MMKLGPTRYFVTAIYGANNLSDLGEHPASLERVVDDLINWLDSRCSQFRVTRVDFDHETDAPESASDVTEDVMDAVTRWYLRDGDDGYVPAMNDREARWPSDAMGAAADAAWDREQADWAAE